MITFREKTFDEWSICPLTGQIFNTTTGKVQKLYLNKGRPEFKRMPVHIIMAHTFYGYNPDLVVHHIDGNIENNSLGNLTYLTRGDHCRKHMMGNKFNIGRHPSEETLLKMSNAQKGRVVSDETKKKISLSHMGEKHPMFGKHASEETKAKMSASRKGKHIDGHPQTEETRKKISATLKERHNQRRSNND